MTDVRPPWPPERWPTPDEWLDWILTLPRVEQVKRAERALDAMLAAHRCFVENHARRLEDRP